MSAAQATLWLPVLLVFQPPARLWVITAELLQTVAAETLLLAATVPATIPAVEGEFPMSAAVHLSSPVHREITAGPLIMAAVVLLLAAPLVLSLLPALAISAAVRRSLVLGLLAAKTVAATIALPAVQTGTGTFAQQQQLRVHAPVQA